MIQFLASLFLYVTGQDRILGTGQGQHRYDLSLNKDKGGVFLMILIGLMTFLAYILLSGFLSLHLVAGHWSAGLENRVTVEIPAQNVDESIRTTQQMAALEDQTIDMLKALPFTKDAQGLKDDEISEMLEPWLGDFSMIEEIPVPALITLDLERSNPEILAQISLELKKINPNILIQTHQDWFADLMRLIHALQFSSVIIFVIVGVTTFTAISGGILSQISIHRKDIELLHLIGAQDNYITRQFQRYAAELSLKGALSGFIVGLILSQVFYTIAGSLTEAMLPELSFTIVQYALLACLPLIVCLIATITARITVLRSLSAMP